MKQEWQNIANHWNWVIGIRVLRIIFHFCVCLKISVRKTFLKNDATHKDLKTRAPP